VTWAINERLDVERQLVRAICHDIARGVSPPGDAMPSPGALAQERVLNPHVVESAYAKLVEAGLVCVGPPGDYQITEHAPRLARDCLLQWAEEEMKDLAGALRRAGLSTDDVQRVFREAGDA
jgi:DNA-binding transcriptional regulator YhcF (GntR family)